MPVYTLRGSNAANEYVVMPRTLKTVEVQRFTIRTEGGATVVRDAGTDEREARKPSRRSTISSKEFSEAMRERSPDVPDKLMQFLDDVAAIDVRVECLASLNLKWDQPAGKPVNLGIVMRSGEIWTDATSWTVDRDLGRLQPASRATLRRQGQARYFQEGAASLGGSSGRHSTSYRGRGGSIVGLDWDHRGVPERRSIPRPGRRDMNERCDWL